MKENVFIITSKDLSLDNEKFYENKLDNTDKNKVSANIPKDE